jgi:hypothetical protein
VFAFGLVRQDAGSIALDGATKAVLLAAAAMFLAALVLGVWKYRQMASSPTGLAHPYVDTAHRAALLYSFALLLIATFVQFSGFSSLVNLLAAGAMTAYFYAAVGSYVLHGARADTDNQMRDAVAGTHTMMTSLIVAEIGGWLVLIAGFLDGQVF